MPINYPTVELNHLKHILNLEIECYQTLNAKGASLLLPYSNALQRVELNIRDSNLVIAYESSTFVA